MQIIDGNELSKIIRQEIAAEVVKIKSTGKELLTSLPF